MKKEGCLLRGHGYTVSKVVLETWSISKRSATCNIESAKSQQDLPSTGELIGSSWVDCRLPGLTLNLLVQPKVD